MMEFAGTMDLTRPSSYKVDLYPIYKIAFFFLVCSFWGNYEWTNQQMRDKTV